MKYIKIICLILSGCFFSGMIRASDKDFIISKDFIYEKAPFVECHASSIESTPNGLVATWFGGSIEGNKDVEIWVSHYKNGT